MNNEEYLKHISEKPMKAAVRTQSKFFSPGMIKLFAGLFIAVILLIAIASMLGGQSTRANTLTERLYARMSLLSGGQGPIATYSKNLFSSDLRALTSSFQSNLSSTVNQLKTILPNISVEPDEISTSITEGEQNSINNLVKILENAHLNAFLDHAFSSQMALQIAMFLSLESEIFEKTSSQPLRDLLDRSTTSLKILEAQFTNFTNSN